MHACAVTSDHMLYCWGSDYSGQLAPRFAVTSAPPECTSTDYRVLRAMAGDPCAAYALTTPLVYEPAHGSAVLHASYEEVVDVDPIVGASDPAAQVTLNGGALMVSRVSAGAHHTCAVSEAQSLHPDQASGRVLCWGDNSLAQQVSGSIPTEGGAAWVRRCDASGAPGAFLENIVDVDAGALRTCALDNASNVVCWGNGRSCAAPVGLLPDEP